METISNVATAAAKAVWGEADATKEPVSGVKGDVAKGEPYDAGNLDTPAQERVEMRFDNNANKDGLSTSDKPISSNPVSSLSTSDKSNSDKPLNSNPISGLSTSDQSLSDKPISDKPISSNPIISNPISSNPISDKSTSDESATDKLTTGNTTVAAPPKGDTSGGQNDTRHPDEVPDTLDPDSLTGPGPKPVDVIARQHGGDAGQAKHDLANAAGTSSGDNKGLEEDKAEGIGEVYVKTSGFNADGGDFDAKNPGAGREADRLYHKKHPDDETSATTAATADHSHSQPNDAGRSSSPTSTHGKDKPSLSERIKAKFHKH